MSQSYLVFFILSLLIAGCVSTPSSQQNDSTEIDTLHLKYAKGFVVTRQNNHLHVEVKQPHPGARTGHKYLLVQRGAPLPDHDVDTKIIRIPISTIVCTSTTHIPLLDYLNKTSALVGFPTLDYISSEKARKLIDNGKITDLGVDKGLNIERLISLGPDVVMGYTLSSDYGQFKKIEELGVPVVLNAEYLEQHPLGKAEWIKFMALFFGLENMADSVFNAIEKSYLETTTLTNELLHKPSALSGVVYGDAWFLPGGQNYAARLLKDAGYQYVWSDNSSNGFIQLSFEAVYEKANQADYWIGVASYTSLQELKASDMRYGNFKAFQTGNVFSYDARHGAKGGSEFLELGYLRADLVLQDLVKIANPDLLPNHTLYFHRKLN
jgi:iron complex transport system substrate-binding protein